MLNRNPPLGWPRRWGSLHCSVTGTRRGSGNSSGEVLSVLPCRELGCLTSRASSRAEILGSLPGPCCCHVSVTAGGLGEVRLLAGDGLLLVLGVETCGHGGQATGGSVAEWQLEQNHRSLCCQLCQGEEASIAVSWTPSCLLSAPLNLPYFADLKNHKGQALHGRVIQTHLRSP